MQSPSLSIFAALPDLNPGGSAGNTGWLPGSDLSATPGTPPTDIDFGILLGRLKLPLSGSTSAAPVTNELPPLHPLALKDGVPATGPLFSFSTAAPTAAEVNQWLVQGAPELRNGTATAATTQEFVPGPPLVSSSSDAPSPSVPADLSWPAAFFASRPSGLLLPTPNKVADVTSPLPAADESISSSIRIAANPISLFLLTRNMQDIPLPTADASVDAKALTSGLQRAAAGPEHDEEPDGQAPLALSLAVLRPQLPLAPPQIDLNSHPVSDLSKEIQPQPADSAPAPFSSPASPLPAWSAASPLVAPLTSMPPEEHSSVASTASVTSAASAAPATVTPVPEWRGTPAAAVTPHEMTIEPQPEGPAQAVSPPSGVAMAPATTPENVIPQSSTPPQLLGAVPAGVPVPILAAQPERHSADAPARRATIDSRPAAADLAPTANTPTPLLSPSQPEIPRQVTAGPLFDGFLTAAEQTTAPLAADGHRSASSDVPAKKDDLSASWSSDVSAAVLTGAVADFPSLATRPPQTTPQVDRAAVHQVVAETIRQVSLREEPGTQRFQMRLDPPELGELTISIHRSSAGDISVHVAAASTETHALLERHAGDIAQSLNDQGLSLSSFDLSQRQQGFSQQGYLDWEAAGNLKSHTEAFALADQTVPADSRQSLNGQINFRA